MENMKRWEILKKIKKQSRLNRDQNSKFKNEDIINILLENRGFKTKKEIDSFLNPDLNDITLDSVNIDKKEIDKTLKRINLAVENKEQVVIYGDYDVDGITASAILWETLFFDLKAKVSPYIPHRVDEGYGISIKGIDNLKLKYPDVKLIITVDNGIVANEAIEYAKKLGVDVIVTDHHVAGEKLPEAYSIIHTTKLCGAGVAYMLVKEITKQMANGKWGGQSNNEGARLRAKRDKGGYMANDVHLELAALGTIADLVSLKGANRAIVKFGLKKLSETKRPGLLALYEEAGIDKSKIGAYEVGHIIAPRLNATGRMESAMDSLRLICTKDPKRASDLASLLGTTNKERQNVMFEATKHASLSMHSRNVLKKLLVVSHEAYSEGIIGLVAGRLVEEFYRPSIVISLGKTLSKGSVRSISGFNIIEFLRNSSEFFVNVGGHPMAAGFTIETEKIKKMQEALEELAEAVDDELFIRSLRIDCDMPFFAISTSLYEDIQNLAPFGMGNPEPAFATFNRRIVNMRIIGKNGNHMKMMLNKDGLNFDAICFGMGERASEFNIGDKIDIAFTIDQNKWNGNTKLQLKVKDVRKTEAIVKEEEVR